MSALTREDIKTIGKDVRRRYESTIGNCFPIAEDVADRLREEGVTAEVRECSMGEVRETHFVVAVPCEQVSDVAAGGGLVYIDASIDQFTQANEEEGVVQVALWAAQVQDVPDVGIYPPGCEERLVWYFRPNE